MTYREVENFKHKIKNYEANSLKREGLSLEDAQDLANDRVEGNQVTILLYEILRELRRIK